MQRHGWGSDYLVCPVKQYKPSYNKKAKLRDGVVYVDKDDDDVMNKLKMTAEGKILVVARYGCLSIGSLANEEWLKTNQQAFSDWQTELKKTPLKSAEAICTVSEWSLAFKDVLSVCGF